ncbi:MAG: tetratricopeptide repeat protein [Rhodospirillaceae bacterium]
MDRRLTLAIKYYKANLYDQAWSMLEELLKVEIPSNDALSLASEIAFERRDLDAAVTYCDRLLSQNPCDAHTLLIKGRALSDLNQYDKALICLQAAAKEDGLLAAAHYNLGWVQQALGMHDQAIAAYRSAIALQDHYPVAWNNLGLMLEQAGDVEGAVDAFHKAILQSPTFSAAYNNLGAALAAVGKFRAASIEYQEALRAAPDNHNAKVNLGVAMLEQADIAEAARLFKVVRTAVPGHSAATDNALYAELYRRDDDLALRADHLAAGYKHKPSRQAKDCITDSDPNRPLKVGFLSPDFRRHSVSSFSLPLIESLKAEQVNTHLFNDTVNTDSVTEQFCTSADVWHNTASLSNEELTQYLRDQMLDCLVDLAGRTAGNRLTSLSCRVAPIQITALGYPGPSGLSAMDYWLCDSVTNPPHNNEDFSCDQPLRLERGLHVFAPSGDEPDVSQLPATESEVITFGSFNKLAKLSDSCVELWADVLKAVDGSRLLLKARALTEIDTLQSLRKRFEKCGVDPVRIEAHGWVQSDYDHLALYQHIDVALDTVPYNGTTTTCEALWMGVPVLTLAGRGHAARVGASLLTSAGLRDWIAPTREEFVAIARSKVADLESLGKLRATLRTQLENSGLTDGPATAHAFAQTLRLVWQQLCANCIA